MNPKRPQIVPSGARQDPTPSALDDVLKEALCYRSLPFPHFGTKKNKEPSSRTSFIFRRPMEKLNFRLLFCKHSIHGRRPIYDPHLFVPGNLSFGGQYWPETPELT